MFFCHINNFSIFLLVCFITIFIPAINYNISCVSSADLYIHISNCKLIVLLDTLITILCLIYYHINIIIILQAKWRCSHVFFSFFFRWCFYIFLVRHTHHLLHIRLTLKMYWLKRLAFVKKKYSIQPNSPID